MNRFTWSAHPALRAAFSLALGITLGRMGAVPPDGALALIAASTTVLVRLLHRERWWGGLVAIPLVVGSGALLVSSATQLRHGAIDIERAECVGRVVEEPYARARSTELVVECDSIILRNARAKARDRVLVRIEDTAAATTSLRHGDRVSIVGHLRAPRPPVMPGAFDERSYLRGREITMTLRVDRAREVHRIASGDGLAVSALSSAARASMARFAREYVRGDAAPVVEALLYGERRGIDPEVRSAFATTGTLHVLAVSGLHVAVIALALSVLASWIPSRTTQFTLFALVLGAYALVAGAGPSIVRAWCMATFVMLARHVGRRTRPLNVLAAAAVAILLARPADLFDIGFQLSFGAVASIVLFNPRWSEALDRHWPTLRDRPVIDRPLRAIALTIAAQLLTLPLLLVHFGSVPALGLLLNLPVVPLTSCAMAAAAIGVLVSWSPWLAAAMGATAYVATTLAVAIVEWGAGLPAASLTLAPISTALAAAAIALVVWSACARSVRAMILRLVATALVTAIGMDLEARLTGLDGAGRVRAYIVPSARGALVATLAGDTLAVATSGDTTGVAARRASLAALLGASHAIACPPRALTRYAPVVLDADGARTRQAGLDGVPVLVVGGRTRPSRMLVYELDGRWKEVPWH